MRPTKADSVRLVFRFVFALIRAEIVRPLNHSPSDAGILGQRPTQPKLVASATSLNANSEQKGGARHIVSGSALRICFYTPPWLTPWARAVSASGLKKLRLN